MAKKSPRHRLLELFIILAVLLIIMAKLFLRDKDANMFLFSYGVLVTIVTWSVLLSAFKLYKDPYDVSLGIKKQNGAITREPLVSCMVAVKNEEGNIARCLDSMLNQTYKNKEIIVVNDGSTDRTLEILRNYEKTHSITVINLIKNVGKKRALAEAMAVARGELFAHTDSDSIWAPNAIKKIVTIFQYQPNVGAVSGHGRALNAENNVLTKAQDAWMEGQFSVRKAFESIFGAVSCVSGPLAVFRRETIFNYIPAWINDRFLGQEFWFATDRTMTGFVLGSAYLGKKLKNTYKDSPFIKNENYPDREWRVVYTKSAKSWTIVPDTFRRLIKQQVRWKKSFIRNLFFTGLFYWRKPLPVAVYYYLHVLFVLVGPYVAFRHLIYLPAQGNVFSAVLYISGIVFIGFMFGLACKLEDKESSIWIYRPIMSLLSTLVISWLIFYSAITIRKMAWRN